MGESTRRRYLTKSRYKLALECPTKLFYAGKPKAYADESIDDAFLRALEPVLRQDGVCRHRFKRRT